MTNWDDLLRRLNKDSCQCGSGGPMACDDDCPGDTTDPVVREALIALVEAHQANFPRSVIMCTCPNWETCEHPWPQMLQGSYGNNVYPSP